MKLALVYDRVNKWGGAEQVLTELHRIWPSAPLYTAVYNPKTAAWADAMEVHPSFLNRLPFARQHHEWLASFTPYAFESFDLSAFDVILSVTSAEAKGVITSPQQLHLCYLLTPTRYLWSHYNAYAGTGLKRALLSSPMHLLRQWDEVACHRPDRYICISETVANRCLQYYHQSADAVIYPPVDTHRFQTAGNIQRNRHWLIVSRLVSYKRIDLAIKACNLLHEPLRIIGSGHDQARLKAMAGPTITFMGHCSDTEVTAQYLQAGGFIFPQEEDFGITAVEAQAAGLPVVAYGQGSSREIIKDQQTGIFFNEPTVTSLVAAMRLLKTHTWYDKTIKDNAAKFDAALFRQQIKSYVEAQWQQHQSK